MNELEQKADLVPLDTRLEIIDLLNKWRNNIYNDMARMYDLFDIYWYENFEKIDRHCNTCLDRMITVYKLWERRWTSAQ